MANAVLGEEIMHYRTRKPGTIVSVQLGDGNAADHIYGVQYQATVDSKRCGNASLRPPMTTTSELRSPPVTEVLTSAKLTHRGVFKTVATCMAGMEAVPPLRSAAAWADQRDHSINDLEICTCSHEPTEKPKTRNLPSVPHTNQILLKGQNPYALLVTGAAPNLIRTGWLKTAWPDYSRHLDNTGAATTKFKLADGGKSASPDGTIILPLTIKSQASSGYWKN